jgi:methionine-rich copper-binding protein CopC
VPAAHRALSSSPESVSVRFSEPVLAPDDALRVTDRRGRRVSGPVRVFDDVVAVQVPRGLAAGKYRVRYRVVADDGHVLRGTYRFKVRAAPAPDHRGKRDSLAAPAGARADAGTDLLLGGLAAAAAVLLAGIAARRRRYPDTPRTWREPRARALLVADAGLLLAGAACVIPLFLAVLR